MLVTRPIVFNACMNKVKVRYASISLDRPSYIYSLDVLLINCELKIYIGFIHWSQF